MDRVYKMVLFGTESCLFVYLYFYILAYITNVNTKLWPDYRLYAGKILNYIP